VTEKWEKQKSAIRATQLAFDLSAQVQKKIKKKAIDSDLTPSDMIRKILGLEVKSKKTRQRLTFYLNDEELTALASRYNIGKDDKITIKQKVAEELIDFAADKKS
jgi:tryptophanyl-tRNA synthetase